MSTLPDSKQDVHFRGRMDSPLVDWRKVPPEEVDDDAPVQDDVKAVLGFDPDEGESETPDTPEQIRDALASEVGKLHDADQERFTQAVLAVLSDGVKDIHEAIEWAHHVMKGPAPIE